MMIRHYGLPRVEIAHANVTCVNFRRFDAFYLFNPFEENVYPSLRIDYQVELTHGLYVSYTDYVRGHLGMAPAGTRVVTYCGDCDEIPECYDCQDIAFAGRLKFWIKTPPQPSDPEEGAPNKAAPSPLSGRTDPVSPPDV